MGMLRTMGSPWSAYLHVNFQNASPTFHHTIVMLLYLFCLGTGPEVGQHSVLALPWLSLCPTGGKPDCYFPLVPQLPSAAVQSWEVLSLYWGLKLAGTCHGNVPALSHRPGAGDSGGGVGWGRQMISICLVATIVLLSSSLACPHH